MSTTIRAISLDLDDTLWPVGDVIQRAEAHLMGVMQAACPRIFEHHDAESLRQHRFAVYQRHPELSHDMTQLRERALDALLREFNYDSTNLVPNFMESFLEKRNDVRLFDDVPAALQALSRKVPLIALSNGNACVKKAGLGRYFQHHITAIAVGHKKPSAKMFEAVCAATGLAAEQILHVGDHPRDDILGALNAGMQTAWINRDNQAWSADSHQPHHTVSDLTPLLHLL